MDRSVRTFFRKILDFSLIFVIAVSWVFSGWPQIWHNPSFPPDIDKALAVSYSDFKVIRGTSIVPSGSGSVTITEGVEYTLESGVTINDAFIRITNTHLTGQGPTSGGTNANIDDTTVRIDNPENLLTSINFTHVGTGDNSRVDWEIIQYVGPSGGANEMIVRATGDIATSGTTATVTGTTVTTISDINKTALFITGQANANTARAGGYEGLFTGSLVLNGSDYDPTFTRGASTATTGYVSYAVVEFTGSNWRDVQRLSITTEATAWTTSNQATTYSDVNITTYGGAVLLDASKTFMHMQYSTSNTTTGLDDQWDNIEILSTTQLRIRNSATSGTRTKVVWLIENTQSSTGAMSVEHIQFYDSTLTGSEERQWIQSITAISVPIDQASIMGEAASMDGGGTTKPRGPINVRLTAVGTVTLTEADRGQERMITFDVVQWPTAPADLTWNTGSADFEIWESGSLTWDAGTLICGATLTDDNGSTVTCDSDSIAASTEYRVQTILNNTGSASTTMNGASDYVDHVAVKGGWGGTTPTISASTDCAFNDTFDSDDGATTCNVAFNSNDVRITNIGAGNVVVGGDGGSQGFMYLITTDSDVPSSDSTSYMNTSIDGTTEDSSKVTISGASVSAPTVTTSSATSVDTDSATLNGEITDTGGEDATQHGFAYGTDSTLSTVIATTTLGSKSGTGTFNEAVGSLDPNTTYYFRAYATNSGGTGFGSTLNFTTDALVYSVSITSSGVIAYGFVEIGNATTTVNNGYAQTALNDGNTAAKFNVRSSDATGGTTWTLASAIGSDIFKHEFSTTTGSTWDVMPDNATYVLADPSVAESGTVTFDFQLTVPSASTDYQEKSITITVQAVAP